MTENYASFIENRENTEFIDFRKELEKFQEEIRNPSYNKDKDAIHFPYDWNKKQYDLFLKPDKKGNVNVEFHIWGKKQKELKNEKMPTTVDEFNYWIWGILDTEIKGSRERVPEKGKKAFPLLDALSLVKKNNFKINIAKKELDFKVEHYVDRTPNTYDIKISPNKEGYSVIVDKNGLFNKKNFTNKSLDSALKDAQQHLLKQAGDNNPKLQEATSKKIGDAKKVYQRLILKQ